MESFKCLECSRRVNEQMIKNIEEQRFSEYSLEKFLKHTGLSDSRYDLVSYFSSDDKQRYFSYILSATYSGCWYTDAKGRENIIYYAGEKTGLTYRNGELYATCSGIIIACADDIIEIHAYPESFKPETKYCSVCGKHLPINYWK